MRRSTRFLCVVAIALLTGAASAQPGPNPPCAKGAIAPAFASPGPHPNVSVWFASDLEDGWTAPECLGWQQRDTKVLVATAGRFREPGGSSALVRRLAAVSDYTAMQYWSVTRQLWRPLIKAATALSGPDEDLARADFDATELQHGSERYFWQDEETPAGGIVYRLLIRARTEDRLELELENARDESFLLMPLFGAGEFQTQIVFAREAQTVWRYYSLQWAAGSSTPNGLGHRASYINRAAAIFRHLTGQPTNAEPPLAPHED